MAKHQTKWPKNGHKWLKMIPNMLLSVEIFGDLLGVHHKDLREGFRKKTKKNVDRGRTLGGGVWKNICRSTILF